MFRISTIVFILEDEEAAKEARLASITSVAKPLVSVLYPDINITSDSDAKKKGKRKYPQVSLEFVSLIKI